MKAFCCAFALLALAGRAAALGTDVPYERFAVSESVREVRSCGRWGPRSDPGFYRIVHAERYAQSFVYVQWMHRDGDGALRAAHTLPIRQLNNDHAEIALEDIACRAQRDRIVLSAHASSGHAPRMRRVRIDVGPAFGHYRFRTR